MLCLKRDTALSFKNDRNTEREMLKAIQLLNECRSSDPSLVLIVLRIKTSVIFGALGVEERRKRIIKANAMSLFFTFLSIGFMCCLFGCLIYIISRSIVCVGIDSFNFQLKLN